MDKTTILKKNKHKTSSHMYNYIKYLSEHTTLIEFLKYRSPFEFDIFMQGNIIK